MKVTIITFYNGSFPFIDELLVQLTEKSIEVSVFDMVEMYTVKLVNGEKLIEFHTNNSTFRKLCGIRFLGTILRILFYKKYLKRIDFSSDHINIHYALPYYAKFMNYFKMVSKSVSIVIWGSDFLRVSEKKRNMLRPLFDKCDSILIPNTQLASTFTEFYKRGIEKKIKSVGFGIGKLEIIGDLMQRNNKDALKSQLSIPKNKLVVTIGYNGLCAQQHLFILEAFGDLNDQMKNNLFLIVPFGYGGDVEYKSSIIQKIENLNISYQLNDSFISDTDVAKIRVCTDLVINAQISDGSSASLQEHLYANNVLLVGDWLQYNHFSNVGIKFWSFNKQDLGEKIISILNNFEAYREKVLDNRDLVYNMSSWDARIDQWLKIFENKL